jgi:DnaK suppressor protein
MHQMKSTALNSFREQLLTLGDRLEADVSHLGSEAYHHGGGNLSNLPRHLADLGADSFDQEMTMGLLNKEREALAETAAALARIEQGTFGRCEECRMDISTERLEALPHARYCIDCARALEPSTNLTV